MRRLLVVGLVGMALAGCSGASSSASPLAVLAGAPAQTSKAQTAHTSFTIEAPGLPAFTVDGGFDFVANRGIFSADLPAVRGGPKGKIEFVTDGPVFYVKFPAALSGELGGKPWVKFDLNAIGREAAGVDLSSITQAQSGDPTQAVGVLRGATDVTRVGTETLRGASVTHYKATLDVDKAIANAPAASRDAMQKLAGQLGTRTIPAEVWVDGQGRLRKLTEVIDLSKISVSTSVASPFSRPGPSTFTYELYDFGSAVHADVPPPDQVTDLADVLHK